MKSILFLNIIIVISNIIAQNPDSSKLHDVNEPVIDPLELVLNSSDSQGTFYCNSRMDIKKQRNKLVASIDNNITVLPRFELHSEQANSTTIHIRISPNGYIGINRISCHWDNNVTYGQAADLIIGEKPGVIQLKERCRAFDLRYVECIYRAPIIARAFLNGFPRLYKFSELQHETLASYHPPTLVNITNENELIFHFRPRDRYIIPKKIPMSVNMTLSRFGSSIYHFNIEPSHTTKVDFQIENISSNKLTIRINHNNTGTISQRLCSGHVNRVDDRKILTAVQDIPETTDQKIVIKGLQSSTNYSICFRCYYEQTDESFRKEICLPTKTSSRPYPLWITVAVVTIALISISVGSAFLLKHRNKRKGKPVIVLLTERSEVSSTTDSDDQSDETPNLPIITPLRYSSEPELTLPLLVTTSHSVSSRHSGSGSQISTGTRAGDKNDPPDNSKYQPMRDFMREHQNPRQVSPDTYDLYDS